MRIILLAKPDNYSVMIESFLVANGHSVHTTFELPTVVELAGYDLGVAWFYPHILSQAHLDAVRVGIVNNHPAYLPYNRGANPNVWSLVEHTPAGVTVHWMNSGLDKGNLIQRQEVIVDPTDTAYTLYHKLLEKQYYLFKEAWTMIDASVEIGERIGIPQIGTGTYHRVADARKLWDLDQYQNSRQVLDILRAGTFQGYKNCYFTTESGKKIYVSIKLEE